MILGAAFVLSAVVAGLWLEVDTLRRVVETFERPPDDELKPPILARWVQLVPAPGERDGALSFPAQALVRAVFFGDARCPAVRLKGDETSFLHLARRDNPAFADFPVTICEALVPRRHGAVKVDFDDGGDKLSVPKLDGQTFAEKIVVLGDTGCRGNYNQYCDEPGKWRFQELAEQASRVGEGEASPDLVVHVGDYVYRGLDNWDTWRTDFFDPAKRLLNSAPWVMVRGNHESCSDNAGQGWHLFLSHHVAGDTIACKGRRGRDRIFLGPYAMRVDDKLTLVMLDSANADTYVEDRPAQKYKEQFKTIREYISREGADDANRWLLSHVPIWGCGREEEGEPIMAWRKHLVLPEALNLAKREAEKLGTTFELRFDAILSGDLHLYQALRFPAEDPIREASDQARQYIVGNGGVQLDPEVTERICTRDAEGGRFEQAQYRVVDSNREFGFLLASRDTDTWTFDPQALEEPPE